MSTATTNSELANATLNDPRWASIVARDTAADDAGFNSNSRFYETSNEVLRYDSNELPRRGRPN